MHFVDNVDLALDLGGSIMDLVAQVAHVVDRVVGGGVNLDQVKAAVGQHGLAGRTVVAGLTVLRVQTVDGTRQDACGAGLAGAAWAREEVGMAESAGPHGVAQRLRDVRLAHHLEEATRPPFAVERWPCCRRWMLHNTPSAVSSPPSGLSVTA